MLGRLWLACATLLLATLSAYTFTSFEPRADFVYVNPSDIHTLDPARISWTQDFRVALNLWEGLTALDPRTLEVIGGAAEFPPEISVDGLAYTFTIGEDGRWSNGDPVTAGDFVRGWRRAMEPGTAADYAFFFTDHVAGAAEYVHWRRDAVATLTALSRLKGGWSPSADQARRLLDSEFGEAIRAAASAADAGSVLAAEEAHIASVLPSLGVDWRRLHERAWGAHVAQLDARFAQVGLAARDERTLVVRLRRPCPYFLDLTALPVMFPCHESIDRLREGSPLTEEGLVVYDPQWTKPAYYDRGYPGLVTNGPYRLEDWTFKRRARLTVNPAHRTAASIPCRVVEMQVIENLSAALMAYEAGQVDFLPSLNVPYDHELARLARTGERPDIHLCPVSATYFLNFNCLSEEVRGRTNPFRDVRIRRAFSLAIDKVRIVKNVLQRGDRVARSFVPPGAAPGYTPPAGPELDVEQARLLLAEAGFAEGQGLGPVEFLCTARDERAAQALARMWADALGVQVEIRSLESKTLAEEKANHRFMISRGNWYADYNDATSYLDCLAAGSGNNDSGYRNPAYDELLARAAATSDAGERARLLHSAESILVEQDFPIVPILHYVEPIAFRDEVEGLYPNARLWFPFQHVKLER